MTGFLILFVGFLVADVLKSVLPQRILTRIGLAIFALLIIPQVFRLFL